MKKAKRLLSLLLAAVMLCSFPVSASAFTSGNLFGLGTIKHQDKYANYDLYQGVDISYHNGNVNWAKMKAAGVKFVILRAGFRTYRSEGYIKKDPQFDNYIKAAYAQGLRIGIYFYSQATSVKEAREEANFTLKTIAPYKNYITLPVAFDYEFAEVSTGRLDSAFRSWEKSKRRGIMTANATAFCDTIKAAGYMPMIYASKSFFEDNLDAPTLEKKYAMWVAHYINQSKGRNATDYKGKINFWQFSSKGHIAGVDGYVDTNFMYATPAVEAIPNQEYTGAAVEPDITVTNGIGNLTKGIDYSVTFSNNIGYGVATATIKGLGKYASLLSATVNFNIVPKTVAQPRIAAKTTDSITVAWDKTDDADGYQLAYLNYVGVPVNIRTLNKDTDTVTLNNAKTAWSYTYVVRGYKIIGDVTHYGNYSPAQEAITPPVAVTGIETTKRTHNAITLKWNPVGKSEKYFIFRYDESAKRFVYIGCVRNATQFTVKNLPLDTKFRFTVKASKLDENGKEMVSPQSEEHGSYTTVPATKLKSLAAKKGRKIKVKWKNVAGVAGYEVMWSTTKDFSANKKSVEVPAGNTSVTLQAYYAKKKYYVIVRTYTVKNGKKHYSAWSNRLKIKTMK